MKVTLDQYKEDKYYPKIVKAVDDLLQKERRISPIDLFIKLGLLSINDFEKWRKGQVPYLEKVINCNLSKAGRILQILRFHTHDLNMKPILLPYNNKNGKLRCSKTGTKKIEEMYCRHFEVIGKKRQISEDL